MESAIGEISYEARTVNAYSRRSRATRKMENLVDVALSFPSAPARTQKGGKGPAGAGAGGGVGLGGGGGAPELMLADVSVAAKMLFAHGLATKRTLFVPKRVVRRALEPRSGAGAPVPAPRRDDDEDFLSDLYETAFAVAYNDSWCEVEAPCPVLRSALSHRGPLASDSDGRRGAVCGSLVRAA